MSLDGMAISSTAIAKPPGLWQKVAGLRGALSLSLSLSLSPPPLFLSLLTHTFHRIYRIFDENSPLLPLNL